MISDVDEALRNLILDSLTVSRQNVDIKYDLPSRDWASRLNRPTINLFLFDIRENLRLRGADPERVIDLAEQVLNCWREYSDESVFVLAETDGEPHNTITPIGRRRGEDYEVDLVLRNNITTEEFPLGVYHPHQELHHIKKENIGLIEVMGLAVLPSRLLTELDVLKEAMLSGADLRANELTAAHAD